MSYGYHGWHVGFQFEHSESNVDVKPIYQAPEGRAIVGAVPSEDQSSIIVTLDDGTIQTVQVSAPDGQTIH